MAMDNCGQVKTPLLSYFIYFGCTYHSQWVLQHSSTYIKPVVSNWFYTSRTLPVSLAHNKIQAAGSFAFIVFGHTRTALER